MREAEEKILAEGKVLEGGVLKVGSFLNQQIDTAFIKRVGEEIRDLFAGSGVTKILTIETSGIAIAVSAGMAMDLPVVIAKKSRSASLRGDVYTSLVYSFTHNVENHVMVSKEHLPAGEKILVVDDFLAHGSALNGLIAIAEDAACEVVGCCAVIEKGFQQGGDNLRSRGYRIESLAIIDEMTEDGIVFRKQKEK